jgi:hypothetical protein
LIYINVQKGRKELSKALEIGLNRLHSELVDDQNNELIGLFDNIWNMFTLSEEKVDRQFDKLTDLVNYNVENLSNVFIKRLEESKKINDVKLLIIDENTNILHK